MNRESLEVFRSRIPSWGRSVKRAQWRPEIEVLEQRVVPATPSSFESASGIAAKFGTYEVVLTGNGSVTNPFNTKGSVTFTSPTNQSVTVNDFYDGGNIWRARVYVTETGVWQWSASSAADPGLNGVSGTFTATDTGLPGLLQLNPSNPKAWMNSRGNWFNYIGDAAWVLFNQSPTFSPNYQAFVNDAATQGINTLGPVGMLGAWGSTNPSVPGLGNNDPWVTGDNTRYDLSKYQTTDTRLEWIFNAHPNMYVQGQFIGTEWQYNNSWINLPQSVRNDTLDYMIARWGAFPNMTWLVSEDQDTGQASTQAFNRDVGPYLAAHQPWKHLLSTQSINESFAFTTASDLTWVDYIPLQVGSDPIALGANQLQNFASVPRPVQLSEDWYEQDDFWHAELSNSADINFFVRWDFWSWTVAGGSANYGARPFRADPYLGPNTYKEPIAPNTDFSGQALHGLDSIPYLWSYFQSRNIDLSLFTPNNSLVTSWSMAAGDNWNPNLTQRGASEFLVYDPNAGQQGNSAHLDSTRTASFTINLSSAPGTYQVEWYRPIDGTVVSGGTVTGGTSLTFTAPWTGYDVVLRLVQGPVTPPSAPTNITATGGNAQVTLNWTASSGATSYNIYRSTTSGGEGSTPYQAGATGTSFTDTGLTNGTTYYYQVTAVNSSGESGKSSEVSATPSATVLMGETNVTPSDDNGNANLLLAQQTTLATTSTLQSLSFYVTQAAGSLRLGVYDATGPNGGPGALKGQTNAFTPVVGWNTAAVITPVQLTAGTYWLAYLPSSNNLHFRVDPTTGTFKWYSFSFGAMPATFSTTPSTQTAHWSLYATLTLTAPAAPTGLTATAGTAQVSLTWSASSGATSYNIYRSTTSGGEGSTPYLTGVTSTSFTDTGLTSGTTYYYQVTAVNSSGESGTSSEVSATPQLTLPAAPANLSAVAGNAQVSLTWNASSGASSYNIYRATTSGGEGSTPYQAGVSGTSFTDTGVTNGTTYYYQVTAVNSAGESGTSSEASATPQAVAGPVAFWKFDETGGGTAADSSGNSNTATFNSTPTWGSGSVANAVTFNGSSQYADVPNTPSLDISGTTISLAGWLNTTTASPDDVLVDKPWTLNSMNAPYYQYGLERQGKRLVFYFTDTTGTLHQANSSTFLTANTWYHFAVTYDGAQVRWYVNGALNTTVAATGSLQARGNRLRLGADEVPGQYFGGSLDELRIYNQTLSQAEVQTLATVSAPAAPTNLTAAGGNGQVTLSWTASSGATSYNIYRATTSGGEGSTPVRTGVTGTSFTDTGLTNRTTYYYQVTAVNSGGESGKSAEVSATPQLAIPAAPANPSASAGNAQVTLNWTASSGATSYNIYRATTSGGEGSTAFKTGVTGTSFTDTGLTNGTTYYYQVTAVNSGGESSKSAEVSATPQLAVPAAPTNPTASAGNAQVTLNWTASSGATSYNIYRSTTSGGEGSTPYQAGATGTSFTDTGLTNGTTYYYQVTAVNSSGESGKSSEVSATPSATVVMGETQVTPSDDNGNANLLLAQQTTLATAGTLQSLSFYVTQAAGSLRLGVYDASGPNGDPGALKAQTNAFTPVVGWNTAAVITPVQLTAGTYWLAYLPSSNNLHFRVDPTTGTFKWYSFSFGAMPATFSTTPNTQTAHWSLYATLTLTVPAAPTGLTATAGTAQVSLTWTASSGATSYNIYRSTTSGGEGSTPYLTGVTSTSFTDTGLTSGTTYYYQVTAVSSGGESSMSNEVFATPF